MTKYENKIKHYREKMNMTQQELAERLGTDIRNIRRWENGETCPNVLIGMKISKIFGVNLKEIFKFSDQ